MLCYLPSNIFIRGCQPRPRSDLCLHTQWLLLSLTFIMLFKVLGENKKHTKTIKTKRSVTEFHKTIRAHDRVSVFRPQHHIIVGAFLSLSNLNMTCRCHETKTSVLFLLYPKTYSRASYKQIFKNRWC